MNVGLIYCRKVASVGTIAYCETCLSTLGYVDKLNFAHLHNVRMHHYGADGVRITSARRELFPAVSNGDVMMHQTESSSSDEYEPKRKRTRIEEEVLLICVQLNGDESSIVFDIDEIDDENVRTSTPNQFPFSHEETQSDFFNYLELRENYIDPSHDISAHRPRFVLERAESTITISDSSESYGSVHEVATIEADEIISIWDSSTDSITVLSDYSDWSEDIFPIDDIEAPELHEPMCLLPILSTDSFDLENFRDHDNFRAETTVPIHG